MNICRFPYRGSEAARIAHQDATDAYIAKCLTGDEEDKRKWSSLYFVWRNAARQQ